MDDSEPIAPPTAYEDLAGMIDHMLVSPVLANDKVVEGLEIAKRYRVASATVRPCDIDLAVRTLQGSGVRPASVCGFPHGTSNTAAKLYELRDLLRRGAKEIAMVVAIPKLLSREFQHVQTELDQAAESCNQAGAHLKVMLESAWLTKELKIIALICCERAGVDLVATSTGFGPAGFTDEDFALMREHLPEEIGIEAVGAIDTVDEVIRLRDLRCARVGVTGSVAILDEWKARLAATTPASA